MICDKIKIVRKISKYISLFLFFLLCVDLKAQDFNADTYWILLIRL